jgi:hypothetical protein
MNSFSGEVEVSPGQGIGPLKLGMTRAEVKAIVGEESFCKDSLVYYLDNALQVDFVNGKAAFIQLSCHTDKAIPVYKGVPLLQTKAEEVLELFNQEWSFDEDDPELGSSYCYPGVVFCREADPELLQQELDDLGPDDELDRETYRKEIERLSFFEVVVVHSEGYSV